MTDTEGGLDMTEGGSYTRRDHSYKFKKVGFFRPRYYVYYLRTETSNEVYKEYMTMFKIRKKDFDTKDPIKMYRIYEKIGVINKVTKMT